MPSGALMDALSTKGTLHTALGSSRRRAFHAQLQGLVERHFGPPPEAAAGGQQRQQVELPLHTKAYILAKATGVVPASLLGRSGGSSLAAAAPLAPEKLCLFCGSPVSD